MTEPTPKLVNEAAGKSTVVSQNPLEIRPDACKPTTGLRSSVVTLHSHNTKKDATEPDSASEGFIYQVQTSSTIIQGIHGNLDNLAGELLKSPPG